MTGSSLNIQVSRHKTKRIGMTGNATPYIRKLLQFTGLRGTPFELIFVRKAHLPFSMLGQFTTRYSYDDYVSEFRG